MERFWSKVNISGLYSCWEWTACRDKGYGIFSLDGKTQGSHRFAYTLIYGEIPEGHVVHHTCENSGCVNPLHLRTMTRGDHRAHHGAMNSKTHCKRGHERTLDNITIRSACRACNRAKQMEWNEKNRDKINTRRRELYHEKKETA